jgi:hypothetical protein
MVKLYFGLPANRWIRVPRKRGNPTPHIPRDAAATARPTRASSDLQSRCGAELNISLSSASVLQENNPNADWMIAGYTSWQRQQEGSRGRGITLGLHGTGIRYAPADRVPQSAREQPDITPLLETKSVTNRARKRNSSCDGTTRPRGHSVRRTSQESAFVRSWASWSKKAWSLRRGITRSKAGRKTQRVPRMTAM